MIKLSIKKIRGHCILIINKFLNLLQTFNIFIYIVHNIGESH